MDHSTESPFPQPLIDAFRARPDAPAFEYRSRPVARGEVLELIARCAHALRAEGLGPGRPVTLATGVTPEAFALRIAAHLLGCRVTGLPPGLTAHQLAHVLTDAAAVLVTDESTEGLQLPPAAEKMTRLRLGPDLLKPGSETIAPDGLTALGRPDDIALINLTSGSTGRPKGCAQTYRSLTRNWAWQPARWTARTADLAAGYSRYLLFGTLTSAVIFEHLGLSLLGGGTAVIPAPPLEFPRVFEEHRITACLLTVPRLHHILDALRTEPVDTSSLRALLVAGSPLAPHRLAEAVDRLGAAVHHAYGQTETGMLTLLTPGELAALPREELLTRTTVGRPLDTVELSVRDPEGRPQAAGETGEIWARTESAMTGYWQDEEQTREVLRDGWVRTRDLGRLDEDGLLRLTGRSRDVIIVNAVLHYAGAIEQCLAGHPDVDQAYVAGAPDERTGEAAYAFVVPVAGRTPDLAALRARVAAELGEASVPAAVTVVREAPLTPGGKPDKRALLAAFLAGGEEREED
ncbi:class I adenylate-forming enzyme family protein [Streptomyces sp. NPDC057654]|uniref:class I adenylate-forming enzyme family protein n=1 Tax=Streptomyces sp. NPDC057654 TaxID=3346196 RepID=UPI0036982D37